MAGDAEYQVCRGRIWHWDREERIELGYDKVYMI
jgi:hypothetical protein